MDSKANVLANNAFRYEIYCLFLWPVIWAFFAFVLSGWWAIGGFTLGLIISTALSLIPAGMGIIALINGTEFRVRAFFPSVVIICLLLLIALWYGIWV